MYIHAYIIYMCTYLYHFECTVCDHLLYRCIPVCLCMHISTYLHMYTYTYMTLLLFVPPTSTPSTLTHPSEPYPMLILCGPLGAGKGYMARRLVEDFPTYFGLGYDVTHPHPTTTPHHTPHNHTTPHHTPHTHIPQPHHITHTQPQPHTPYTHFLLLSTCYLFWCVVLCCCCCLLFVVF